MIKNKLNLITHFSRVTKQQKEKVKLFAKKLKVSEGEALRMMIDAYELR